MQFTPQQLSGGPKFNSAVKIGNWAEDRARAELEAKDYELRRSKGALATASVAEIRGRNLAPVPHAYSADGYVRYGDSVQLRVSEEDRRGVAQHHFLANNIFEVVDAGSRATAVSCTPTPSALARNTFVITRAPSRTHYESKTDSDILNYGDSFQLASNPSLRVNETTRMVGRPYLLHSEPSSAVVGAGSGSAQSVQMAPVPSANTVWTVVAANGNRLATDGTPVPANADVALYHRATNVALASTLGSKVMSAFGPELAVSCATIKSTGRGAGGAALPGNRWQFVTASDPAAAVDKRDLREVTPEVLIAQVKEAINKRGAYAFRGLSKSFAAMDDRGDGNLDREDFKYGLRDYGIHLTDEEFDIVMEAFDRDGNGFISLTEFLAALRGELSAARREVVMHAFAKLDADCSGKVTIDDLRAVYNVQSHPGYSEGAEERAYEEFLNNWDVQDRDGIVTASEFLQYYGDVGAGIQDDDYFVAMMKSAWKLE